MKKRLFSILLSVCMALTLLPISAMAGEPTSYTTAVKTTLGIEVLPIYGNPPVDEMMLPMEGFTQPTDGSKNAELYWDPDKTMEIRYDEMNYDAALNSKTIYFYAAEPGIYSFTASFFDDSGIGRDYPITVIVPDGSSEPVAENPTKSIAESSLFFRADGGETQYSTDNSTWKSYTGTFTITGSSTSDSAAANTVVVYSGTHNITLSDCSIGAVTDTGAYVPTALSPFDIRGGTVNLTLIGSNKLYSAHEKKAGLRVAAAASLVVTAESTGTMDVRCLKHDPDDLSGNLYGAGAGIGGDSSIGEVSGAITINGGEISAFSYHGAGIGSGYNSSIGLLQTITVNGGTVVARSSDGNCIGHGKDSSGPYGLEFVNINGGSVNASGISGTLQNRIGMPVQLYTLTLSGVSSATAVTALSTTDVLGYTYGTNGMKTDADGKLYVYLPAGKTAASATAKGKIYIGGITSNAATLYCGYAVSGTVTAGAIDTGVSGLTVNLYDAEDTSFSKPLDTATTDGSGVYTFSHVEDGSYVSRVSGSSGNYAASCSGTITVNGEASDGNDITLTGLTTKSIEVSSTSHKTAYKTGDILDVANLKITVTRSDDSTYEKDVTEDMVSGFDSSAVTASQDLTVSLDGKTTTYNISVGRKAFSGTVELPIICTGDDRPASSSITITTKTGQEYLISESSSAPGDWSGAIPGDGNKHKFTNLNERTKYYIHVRVAATETAMPSAPDKVGQYTLPATPDASVVTINYKDETVSCDNQYEISSQNDGTGTEITGAITPGSVEQTIYVRVKAVDGGAPASEWRAVTIPARPAIGATLTVDYSTEKVTAPAGYSYKIGSGEVIDVTDGSQVVALDPSATLTYWKTATDSSFRSEKTSITAPSRLPHSDVVLNFIDEIINTTTAMEYSTDGGTSWTDCTENMSMDGLIKVTDQSIKIREKATADYYSSEVQTLEILARAGAPNVGKTDETIFGKNDGKLTSATAAMEYRPAAASVWTEITGTEISNLGPATYYVRYKATDEAVYSNSQEITIAAGNKITLTFDSKGGSPADPMTDLVYHQTVTLPATTRTGYTFAGWWANSDGTGTELTAITPIENAGPYYAKWTAHTYTVTFKANGGTEADSVQVFTYDEGAKALNNNTFTRTNYTFSGWNTAENGTGTSYANAESVYNLLDGNGANLSLYAQWAESKRHNLSGEVKDDASPAEAVTGATVTLKQGAAVIASTQTNGEGKYSFTNLLPGTYNLVVTKDDKTTTVIYVIAKADGTQNYIQNITLPTAATNNSALVVAKEAGITGEAPKIVVGGLDTVAASQNADITMTVTQKAEDQKNTVQISIKEATKGQSIGMYLDVELKKGADPLTNSGDVLELIFPYSFESKTSVKVWREHNGSIDEFEELTTRPYGSFADKTFYSDKENGLIYVYANKFSTYAVSYTEVSSGDSSSRGGSSGGKVPSVPVTPQTGVGFDDVTKNDWFYDSVMNAVEKGWFTGTSATTFSPSISTTRGMIATVLHRMENKPTAAEASSFEDVAIGSWYCNGITWAQENGIVKGYDREKFGPQDNIAREQMAAILYRYAEFKGANVKKTTTLDSFTDGSRTSQYAAEPMKWAVANGLISGRGNGILDPKAGATRAEVAAILTRFDELLKEK